MAANPQRRIEGKYEILHKIREGGMGAIYKVRHRLLEEVRVIKVMRPQLALDPEFKARFIREARVAIKLRHPNIAQIHDFTIGDDDIAFIVMEFIDGKTIEELLKAGRPPLALALEIAQQSLRALGYLHGKGFVHRDISPDNLMLGQDADGEPQVKLIDLGIAKVLDGQDSHLTRTGTFLGKLRYASPEQFGAAGGTADARADLYSFGLVLYELLTGVYPISGSDPSSLIAGHLFRPPLPFEETDAQGRLPPALRAVVLKSLAKNPEERFATARELASELAAFRHPGDLTGDDWRGLLEDDLDSTANLPAARPSSTQHRLDVQFGPTTTPAPSPLVEVRQAGPRAPIAGATAPANRAAQRAGRRHAAEIERRAAEIGKRLDHGDLDGSATLLDQAVAELGEAPAWQGLRERHRALAAEVRLAQVGALLMRARQLAAKGDHAQALERVDEARQLEPENPGVQALATELARGAQKDQRDQKGQEDQRGQESKGDQRAQRHQQSHGDQQRQEGEGGQKGQGDQGSKEDQGAQGAQEAQNDQVAQGGKERRRAEKLASTVAEVAARLDNHEMDEASKLLDWAVVRFGATPELREKWEQLEQLKLRERQATGHARVEELLADARLLLKIEDFENAARKLARVFELLPGHPPVQALLDQAKDGLKRQAANSGRNRAAAPAASTPPRDPAK